MSTERRTRGTARIDRRSREGGVAPKGTVYSTRAGQRERLLRRTASIVGRERGDGCALVVRINVRKCAVACPIPSCS